MKSTVVFSHRGIPALLPVALVLIGWSSGHALAQDRKLNQIDYAMYFLSDVKDAAECRMSVSNNRIVIPSILTNPATTCPDMFSWKLFTQVIQDQFWTEWADEKQNWPVKPYSLCNSKQTPGQSKCCRPGDASNDPSHCPVFPGDKPAGIGLVPEAEEQLRQLRPSIRAHLFDTQNEVSDASTALALFGGTDDAERESKAVMRPCKDLPLPAHPEGIGRVIRQTNGELTVRNRPFHYFVFKNNLYNANGVIDVYENNRKNIFTNSPYRRATENVTSSNPRANLSKIDFPANAIMIRSNWLNAELMKKIGKQYDWKWDDPDQSYIQKRMSQTLTDENGVMYDCDGVHFLLAFHISSKDIPNWVWATFEHVSLPGRCDYTGCNDSWGYFTSDTGLPAGAAKNFIKPKTMLDDFPSGAESTVYDRDEVYAAESIRPQLSTVFHDLGIGTNTDAVSETEPSAGDRAWTSYRLKGSQVEFTDSMGRPTYLGHSVTEAGFVNGSSCISCHARAGTDAAGPLHLTPDKAGTPLFPLSVFQNDLSDFGYGKSVHGIPNRAWYHESNQPPNLRVLQTDFVWGFLFARPVVP